MIIVYNAWIQIRITISTSFNLCTFVISSVLPTEFVYAWVTHNTLYQTINKFPISDSENISPLGHSCMSDLEKYKPDSR